METVGILGGGQLARMLALAAYPLGIKIIGYSPEDNPCAAEVCKMIKGEYTDEDALELFASQVDVITYETENILRVALEYLENRHTVYPPVSAVITTQDRLAEKKCLNELGIPHAHYIEFNDSNNADFSLRELEFPMILKSRKMGYDGKGQIYISNLNDFAAIQGELDLNEYIAERVVPFERELSLICTRSIYGEIIYYPLTQNHHKSGILKMSKAPINEHALERQAQNYTKLLLEKFNYVGVFTVEFFQIGDRLIVNELAPRVHNSGHWTIEGAQTSQFENHLRAICGLPLGDPRALGQSILINFIGSLPDRHKCLEISGAHYHSYGKPARPKRKLGHLTLVCDKMDPEQITKYKRLCGSVNLSFEDTIVDC